MSIFRLLLIITITGASVAALMSVAAWGQEQPAVVINEIMWDELEYVELYNNSTEEISLHGWKLTRQRSSTEETTAITFFDTDVIKGESFFVVGKKAEAAAGLDKIVSTLVFHNEGELLRLYDAAGNIVDSANRFGSWFAGQNTEFGVAMERIKPDAGGAEASSWQVSTGSIGGRQGTPGQENSGGSENSTSEEPGDEASEAQPHSEAPASTTGARIVISEFLPNPAGSDTEGEFIELFNEEATEISLHGWQLDDAEGGSKSYTIENLTMPARSYAVLYRPQTKIALNNEGDTVRLMSSDGVVRANAVYGMAAEGQSFNRQNGNYVASTTLTPGGVNSITAPAATPASSSESTEEEAVIPSGNLSKHIFINEFLPNPVGSDTENEFIELINTSKEQVNLAGWALDDEEGGSRPYAFSADDSLAPGEIKAYRRPITKLALNNDADEVRVFDPEGALISSFTYAENVSEGISYNRTQAGEYVLSATVTEGKTNIITTPEGADVAQATVAGVSAARVPLKQLRSKELGAVVIVIGTVITPPGILGARIMYISDGEAGVQVYLSSAEFPALSVGDTVEVTGEVSSTGGETRLKVASTTDIAVLPETNSIEPIDATTSSVNETTEGRLVRLRGAVASSSGSTFYIDDGSGEARIVVQASTGINKPKTKKGMAVEVVGVVSETRSGYRVLPRFQEDLRVTEAVAAGRSEAFADESNEGFIPVIPAASELGLVPNLFSEPAQAEGRVLGSEDKPVTPAARRNTLFLVLAGGAAVLIRSGILSGEPAIAKIKNLFKNT